MESWSWSMVARTLSAISMALEPGAWSTAMATAGWPSRRERSV
jgi:hypothetical protein